MKYSRKHHADTKNTEAATSTNSNPEIYVMDAQTKNARSPFAIVNKLLKTPVALLVILLVAGAGTLTLFFSHAATTLPTNCFPNPGACGYPDASTTGAQGALTPVTQASLPSGVSWNAQNEVLSINTPGVTISNLDVPGSIEVHASNVTIRNVKVTLNSGCSTPCGNYGVLLGANNETISGTFLDSVSIVTKEKNPSNDNPVDASTFDVKVEHAVRNNGDQSARANKLYVKGPGSDWKGVGTIENSYLWSQYVFEGDHTENILNGGEGHLLVLNHNTMFMPKNFTAVVALFDDYGPIEQITITNNFVAGGAYTMYGGAKNDANNVKGPVLVKDNRFARCLSSSCPDSHGFFPKSGDFGPFDIFRDSVTQSCGNYWDDNLAEVSGQPGSRCDSTTPPPPPSDTTAPTTSITAPANTAAVSGTVNVAANASDNTGVTKVEFYVDGALKGTDTSSPYSYSWDTTTASNASHTLTTKAYDAANNIGTSAAVTVTVSNGSTTPPPPSGSCTQNVTTSTFASAFSSAGTGAVLCLAPGNYGTFNGGAKSGTVTIMKAPSALLGQVTMILNLNSSTNLVFDGIKFTDGRPDGYEPVGYKSDGSGSTADEVVSGTIAGGSTKNVTISNSDFNGRLKIQGLQNANLIMDGDIFHDWNSVGCNCAEGRIQISGSSTSTLTGITIKNSQFLRGRSDGIQVGDSNGVSILNNSFMHQVTDDRQNGTHTDGIQILGGSKIQIKGNYFRDVLTPIMGPDGDDHNTIEDNVFAAPQSGDLATSPFSIQYESDNGSVIQHNTFEYGSNCDWNISCGTIMLGNKSGNSASTGTVLKDNILSGYGIFNGDGSTVGLSQQSNNLFADTAGTNAKFVYGTNDVNGKPTYAKASRSTYTDYVLATNSLGKGTASDGTDRGARIGATSPTPPPPPAPDTTAPTTAITAPANNAVVSGQAVTVTATAADANGVTKVEFYLGTTLKATDTTAPYSYTFDSTTMANGSALTLTTKAYDPSNNVGTSAPVTLKVDNSDKTAPTAPTSLTAVAASSTQVNLTWKAATDNVGVTQYLVRRDGIVIATLGQTTSYNDTTAVASKTYKYDVLAADAAGNTSPASNVVTVTTPTPVIPDTTPPTPPTNLAAFAASISQINLQWTPSTDAGGSGLKEYRIFRGSTQIATVGPTVTTYGDGTVAPDTSYTYTVKATDSAGNVSAVSNTATARTPAPIPVPTNQTLVGSQNVQSGVDSVDTGQAEAFKAVATTTGTGSTVTLYLDSNSTAPNVRVGVYSNRNGHPYQLLSQTLITGPKAAAWNTVALPTTQVTSNNTYWIAVMNPRGNSGKIKFHDKLNSTSRSETSAQSTLTSLPSTWSTGTTYNDGPLSAYISQ